MAVFEYLQEQGIYDACGSSLKTSCNRAKLIVNERARRGRAKVRRENELKEEKNKIKLLTPLMLCTFSPRNDILMALSSYAHTKYSTLY